jgi:hypothetical protein
MARLNNSQTAKKLRVAWRKEMEDITKEIEDIIYEFSSGGIEEASIDGLIKYFLHTARKKVGGV